MAVSSWLTVKVFNVIGKEIATPVVEYKTEGRYDVEFNENTFPKGVYLSQLIAGDYANSKKMGSMKLGKSC